MKLAFRLACAVALFASPLASIAQEFPTKPIRLIIPLSPGSLTDTIVRNMLTKMNATLGATVVVENQPGAGAIVGVGAAARAAPDGYTWTIGSSASFSANPHLHKQLPYNPVKDFEPICRIGGAPQILVVNPSLGVKSLPELLARAKTESLSFASSGVGTTTHMAQELFKSRVGVTTFVHVPYKGTAQSVSDTVAGHAQLLTESPGPLLGHIRDGKLVPLGSTGARRSLALPNVPTFSELGYKEIRLDGWIGLVAPAGTPAPIVAKISQACKDALASPEIQALSQAQGFDIDYADPKEFRAFIASELQKWGELVKMAGVKAE